MNDKLYALWSKDVAIFALFVDMDSSMDYEVARLDGVSDGFFYAYSGFIINDNLEFYFAGSTRSP